MFELNIRFENEAAREDFANQTVDATNFSMFTTLAENVTPNHVERVGDTIFFTRQPDVPEDGEVAPETMPEVAGTGTSDMGNDRDTAGETSTFGSVAEGELPSIGDSEVTPVLPEVSEANTTEEFPAEVLEEIEGGVEDVTPVVAAGPSTVSDIFSDTETPEVAPEVAPEAPEAPEVSAEVPEETQPEPQVADPDAQVLGELHKAAEALEDAEDAVESAIEQVEGDNEKA